MDEVRVGCSGWSYGDWGDDFYPPGTPTSGWLAHYASVFDTVEVNATFYRLPKLETVRAWANQVPEGFLFAVKGSRYLTQLQTWRGRIASWRARRPVFVYLNNDWQGFAPRNALTLRNSLS